jgi:type IV conjugative transfer system protein TraL
LYKIPQYINKPLTFIGLELVEVVMIYVVVFLTYLSGSFIYFLVITGAVIWFIVAKRKNPQGFYRHALYFAGLYTLNIYPEFLKKDFIE